MLASHRVDKLSVYIGSLPDKRRLGAPGLGWAEQPSRVILLALLAVAKFSSLAVLSVRSVGRSLAEEAWDSTYRTWVDRL